MPCSLHSQPGNPRPGSNTRLAMAATRAGPGTGLNCLRVRVVQGRQFDLFLLDESRLRQISGAQHVEHGADGAGRRDLNRAADTAAQGGGIDLVRIRLLNELTAAQTADRHEDDDDVLQRDGYRVLQNILQQIASIAQAQIIQQRLHDRGVAGVANGAVVEIADLAGQGLAKRAEAAGGVERLVEDSVQGKLFELFERLSFAQLTIDDRLAGLAVLVDDAVRAPGEIVVERVRRKLRQGTDAHAHVLQLVEARGQVAGDDGDEAGCQAALGDERGARAGGELFHDAGAGNVLGQIQVVGAGRLGGFGNQSRGMVGRRGEYGEFTRQNLLQGVAVCDVGGNLRRRHRRLEAIELLLRTVDHGHCVIARQHQKLRDHGTDFARTDQNDVFHVSPRYRDRDFPMGTPTNGRVIPTFLRYDYGIM